MMRKLGKLWLWIVYAFLFLPIFVVIAYSFNAAKYTSAWKGFTLKWYSQLFGNAALIDAVVNTLSVAALAASLATLLGVLAALCLKRTEFPGRQLLHASLYVLTVSPEMVMGISLLIFFISVKLPLGFVSMLIAHTTLGLPFVALKTNRKTGIRAITLDQDDHLINVIRTTGSDNIILATAQGMAICFNENDVRCMGRDAAGVRGISLDAGDFVVGAQKWEEGKTLLTVTENGYGKRTALPEYLRTGPDGQRVPQSRGGKGLKNYNITPKTGPVAGCVVVGESDDVMLIENGGVIIRVPAGSINVYKRDVQGVIVMRIEDGNKLVSLECVPNVNTDVPEFPQEEHPTDTLPENLTEDTDE